MASAANVWTALSRASAITWSFMIGCFAQCTRVARRFYNAKFKSRSTIKLVDRTFAAIQYRCSIASMVSADNVDPFSTPMAAPNQRRLRSTCTPPRKPSAKTMRVMLSESPDNVYNIMTRRTSRSAKRALPFSQGITTPPPSAKSRTAMLASLRGRAAPVRLDFDHIKPSPEQKKACKVVIAGEQQVKMATLGGGAPPAGSVTPPPVAV